MLLLQNKQILISENIFLAIIIITINIYSSNEELVLFNFYFTFVDNNFPFSGAVSGGHITGTHVLFL